MRGVAIRDAGQHVRHVCVIVERARLVHVDAGSHGHNSWLLQKRTSGMQAIEQAGEKAKNAGPVVAKTRLVVGSLDRVWRKFIHVHG